MKQIRIISCSDPMMWYADHIGEIFPLIREEGGSYLTREPAGYTNVVRLADAEIVEDEADA
ncbi:hypothetical protein WCX72_09805 [Sulfurimonas sp. HSL1-6]|uniref:hypothetical protein n=1 Tax=Thiomicrolovo immobilis TaxID=3131935 RepID=UPI0031F7C79F